MLYFVLLFNTPHMTVLKERDLSNLSMYLFGDDRLCPVFLIVISDIYRLEPESHVTRLLCWLLAI